MADAGKIVITPKGAYSSTKTYEWLDEVSYNGNAYVALKTVTGVTPSDDGVNWRLFMSSTDVDANVLVPKFTEASTRSNIVSGENLSTMFGKIKKWFTDLKSHAFKDLVNNLTTSTTGSALDASQGKILKDEVDGVNRNLDIQGLLDKFDGKLDQAYYDVNNGTKAVHSDFVCNTNPICCNSGDSINFKLGIQPKNGLQIIYFNESGYVSGVTKYGTDLTFTAPSGATYFHFNYVRSGGVTPTSAGSISVFINNEIEALNASLDVVEESAITNVAYSDITTKSNSGIDITKNQDGTFTLNGTATSNAGLNLYGFWGVKNYNFLEKSKYTMYLDGNTNENITFQVYAFNNGNPVAQQTARGSDIKTLDLTGLTFDGLLLYIGVSSGTTLDNYVIKPMLVKGENNIPFVPCIGQSSRLVEEVVGIKKDLGEQKKIYSESTINVGRQAGTTVGDNSTAEGADTEASGASSHSEGWLTTASNDCSHAEGNQTGASGIASHSEGTATGASGDYSHAEGDTTTASGESSHAEGFNTTASGNYSHAEGNETTATSSCSHAEGYKTKAYSNSHAEGYNTTANNYSHAECYETTANGTGSHAEGNNTTAKGNYSHAEGNGTEASGSSSHSEGSWTTASGDYSHAEGNETTALRNQHAQGHYNNTSTATANSTNGTSTGTAFVIGNGTSSSKSNAFRVTGEGVIYSTNSSVQTGADYAEYFEWSDENPDSGDRVGYFVTLDEDNPEKIRIANNGDYILGIVSGMPSVIGNGDECWKQRYILDEFGRYIVEEFEYEVVVGVDEETGKEIKETKIGTKWKENPDYDSTKEYLPRAERSEWSAIGMMGVLSVYDDGTCQVNGYCKCTDGGIATACERGADTYRVIARVTDNIVKIVLKS